MTGSLKKLNITAWSNPSCEERGKAKKLAEIDAYVNPENYNREYTAKYEDLNIIGDPAKSLFFSGMGENSITINKLIVDKTGVLKLMDGNTSVDQYLKKFQDTVFNYDGSIHAPRYVKLMWGNLIFKGVCTSLKVDYKLFNAEGQAIRAFIDFTIKENKDFATREMEAQKSSPDLTHVRTVYAGDNLPMMVENIYGDNSYYPQVAKANNLNSIYDLQPGDKIFFPPIKK